MSKTSGFTGFQLKLIALITMFIDHVAAVVVWRLYVRSLDVPRIMRASEFFVSKLIVWVAEHQNLVYTIYEYMRLIGRMAFPIYCFLLIEGFLHTRNVKMYTLRLLLFALISEIPFDMAIAGQWWNLGYSNVFFTLVIGLLGVWLISYVEKFHEFWMEKQWDTFLGNMLTILVGGFFALGLGLFAEMVLHTDYGMAGVFAILTMYLFRKNKELGFALGILILAILSSSTEIVALLMLIPLIKYDGTRGKNIKYFFYLFYPLHLLCLAFICIILGV